MLSHSKLITMLVFFYNRAMQLQKAAAQVQRDFPEAALAFKQSEQVLEGTEQTACTYLLVLLMTYWRVWNCLRSAYLSTMLTC